VIVEWLCAALMVILVGDVFLGVFSRYVLQATFKWYDEVARLCFVWIIFLGAGVAVRRGLHFRLRLLVGRLSPTRQARADTFATLVVIAFSALLVAGGASIAPLAQRQMTDALEVSMLWFYAAVPVGGCLMAFYALRALWHRSSGPPSSAE
jgi:TRAP-type C4-dicarboxylate transport system permease small subunit